MTSDFDKEMYHKSIVLHDDSLKKLYENQAEIQADLARCSTKLDSLDNNLTEYKQNFTKELEKKISKHSQNEVSQQIKGLHEMFKMQAEQLETHNKTITEIKVTLDTWLKLITNLNNWLQKDLPKLVKYVFIRLFIFILVISVIIRTDLTIDRVSHYLHQYLNVKPFEELK